MARRGNKASDPLTIMLTVPLFVGLSLLYFVMNIVVVVVKISIGVGVYFVEVILKTVSGNFGMSNSNKCVINKNKISKNNKENIEGEMDMYRLVDWQKVLVRGKQYDSCNFEEEDLEEDDYHYEDD